MGFDAIHKIIENHVEGAILIMTTTIMDEYHRSHVPFVCIFSHADSKHFMPMLKAIGNYVAATYSISYEA